MIYKLLEVRWIYNLLQTIAKPTTDSFSHILTEIPYQKDYHVLDLACGTSNYRDQIVCEYTGIDINEKYFDPKREDKTTKFIESSVDKLPFEGKIFDISLTIASTHHLTDQQVTDMIKEAFRVSKNGSSFHIIDSITTPFLENPFKWFWFAIDRGRYQRCEEDWLDLLGKNAQIIHFKKIKGPMHTVCHCELKEKINAE